MPFVWLTSLKFVTHIKQRALENYQAHIEWKLHNNLRSKSIYALLIEKPHFSITVIAYTVRIFSILHTPRVLYKPLVCVLSLLILQKLCVQTRRNSAVITSAYSNSRAGINSSFTHRKFAHYFRVALIVNQGSPL